MACFLPSCLADAFIFTCKVYDPAGCWVNASGYLFAESSVMASLKVTPLIFTKKSSVFV